MLIELGCCNAKMLEQIIESALIDKDSKGRTPLMVAVECGNTNVAEYLIKNDYNIIEGREDGMKPIHVAASMGNTQIIEMYMKERDNGNSHKEHIGETNRVNGVEMNALAYACLSGQKDAVRLLIELGIKSIEGYVLAGLIGREDITRLFRNEYELEEGEAEKEKKRERKERNRRELKKKIKDIILSPEIFAFVL